MFASPKITMHPFEAVNEGIKYSKHFLLDLESNPPSIMFAQYPFKNTDTIMNNPNELCRINIEEDKEAIKLSVGLKVGSVLRIYHRKNIPENPNAIVVKYFDSILGYVKGTDENQTRILLHSKEGHKLVAYVTKLNKTNPTLPMLEIGIKHYFQSSSPTSPVDVPL